jgi:hypothetical protein
MRARPGVTLLEATIAMTIVGLIAVATLGEFATELRVGGRAVDARVLDALARDRLSRLLVTPGATLTRLPDSLSKGTFAAPFSDHHWVATVKADRSIEGLLELQVLVRSPDAEFAVTTKLFRPPPRVERTQP